MNRLAHRTTLIVSFSFNNCYFYYEIVNNEDNLKEVIQAGANGVVIGRAVFGADDFKKAYEHFIKIGREYEKELGR